MKIEHVMTREVASCSAADSLDHAVTLMRSRDCGCLPVVDDERRVVVGVVTDRDACMTAQTRQVPMSRISVGQAMSSHVWTCHPEHSIDAAEQRMRRARVRRLPVVDDHGGLVGLLSITDIARGAAGWGHWWSPEVSTIEATRRRLSCAPRIDGTKVVATLAQISGYHGPPESDAAE